MEKGGEKQKIGGVSPSPRSGEGVRGWGALKIVGWD